MPLDSSIPAHLRCPRTRHRRVSDTWKPPYPAFSAKVDPAVEQVVMAYLGVQSKGDATHGKACAAFQAIRESLKLADGPARHDLVQFVDAEGYLNLIVVAYWTDPKAHQKWNNSPEIAGWWASEPDVGRVAHGVPDRLDRLTALGNGVVPQIAYWLGCRIRELEEVK